MRTMRAALLANMRRYRAELITASVLGLSLLAPGGFFAAPMIGLLIGWGWFMGYRKRTLPLHVKVEAMTDEVGMLVDEIRAGKPAAADGGRPQLTVVRGERLRS